MPSPRSRSSRWVSGFCRTKRPPFRIVPEREAFCVGRAAAGAGPVSEQGREDPHARFGETAHARAAEPLRGVDGAALRRVAEVDFGHAGIERPVVDEGVDFEVVFEAAGSPCWPSRPSPGRRPRGAFSSGGTPGGRSSPARRPGSGVEERVRGQAHDARVAAFGEHDPHVDAAGAAVLQRGLQLSFGR